MLKNLWGKLPMIFKALVLCVLLAIVGAVGSCAMFKNNPEVEEIEQLSEKVLEDAIQQETGVSVTLPNQQPIPSPIVPPVQK